MENLKKRLILEIDATEKDRDRNYYPENMSLGRLSGLKYALSALEAERMFCTYPSVQKIWEQSQGLEYEAFVAWLSYEHKRIFG